MLVTVKANVRCRKCGQVTERTFNVPEGVAPPIEFTCAQCTGNATGFDAMAADEVAKFTRRDGRLEGSAARAAKRKRADDWNRKNELRAKARWLFRTDRGGFAFPASMTRAERSACRARLIVAWLAKIEAGCAFCGRGLDIDSAACCRVGPIVPGELDGMEPACRPCAAARAGKLRSRPLPKAA